MGRIDPSDQEETSGATNDVITTGETDPTANLVSEGSVGVDEDAVLADLQEVTDGPVAEHLSALNSVLEELQYKPAIIRREDSTASQVQFELPAGRSIRTVAVDESGAAVLLKSDLASWRSLERFDGVWNSKEGVVEVAIRSERFGLPISRVLTQIATKQAKAVDGKDESVVEVRDDESGVSIRIGDASPLGAVLLSTGRFSPRTPVTLRVSPLSISTTADADDVVERITDSLSVDLGIGFGVVLTPRRLESKLLARGVPRARSGRLTFPKNLYPHAPVALYQAGRDRIASPLIRYWCYYQVLEYFFPSHSEAEAVRQLSRRLRSPVFDPHNDEDVLAAVQLAVAAGKGHGSEEEQLHTTLKAIVTPSEVLQFVRDRKLTEQMADKASELTNRVVSDKSADDTLQRLAQRIYDIRCRIVHSKSGSQRGEGPGLLPGTAHDDLVRNELLLMEFLAQQALLTSADRLSL